MRDAFTIFMVLHKTCKITRVCASDLTVFGISQKRGV